VASSKQSCAEPFRRRYLVLLGVFLAVLVALPIAIFSQDHEGTSSEEGHKAAHAESPLAIVWKWGNFLILFGGLGWYLRKPLQEFLTSRSKSIEEGLETGRRAKEGALKKLSEIEARLSQMDTEIKRLKDQALAEAEEEKTHILADAREEATRILDMARKEIEGLKKTARLELRSHVAQLAVKLAEERLGASLTPEANSKMIQQFLQTLDTTKN